MSALTVERGLIVALVLALAASLLTVRDLGRENADLTARAARQSAAIDRKDEPRSKKGAEGSKKAAEGKRPADPARKPVEDGRKAEADKGERKGGFNGERAARRRQATLDRIGKIADEQGWTGDEYTEVVDIIESVGDDMVDIRLGRSEGTVDRLDASDELSVARTEAEGHILAVLGPERYAGVRETIWPKRTAKAPSELTGEAAK